MTWKKVVRDVVLVLLITAVFAAGGNMLLNAYFIAATRKAKEVASTRGVYRYRVENYDGVPWAKQFFAEYDSLKTHFKSYVCYRRNPFSGQTIHIDKQGYRYDPEAKPCSAKKEEVWFFGGSTTWGVGVRDALTMPLYFQKMNPKYCVRNLGETAYRSRQELALLINLLFTEKRKPAVVVFYDGVNDCYYSVKNRAVNMSTPYERIFNKRLEESDKYKNIEEMDNYWALVRDIALQGAKYLFTDGFLALWQKMRLGAHVVEDEDLAAEKTRTLKDIFEECQLPERERKLIRLGVNEQLYVYNLAYELCKKHGIRLVVLLQPNAWIGNPKRDHIIQDLSARPECLAEVYRQYYAALREKAATLPYFYDISNAFDSDEAILIDMCHTSANGNKIIASEVSKIINKTERVKDKM